MKRLVRTFLKLFRAWANKIQSLQKSSDVMKLVKIRIHRIRILTFKFVECE